MARGFAKAALIAAVCLLPAACTWDRPSRPGPEPIWQSGATDGFIELADSLRSQGLRVKRHGRVRQPFFSVEGQVMRVERGAVQVFDYPNEASRAEESAAIAPDGMRIGTRPIAWDATPHVWTDGTRIVLYTGTDEVIIEALTRVLGSPLVDRTRADRADA